MAPSARSWGSRFAVIDTPSHSSTPAVTPATSRPSTPSATVSPTGIADDTARVNQDSQTSAMARQQGSAGTYGGSNGTGYNNNQGRASNEVSMEHRRHQTNESTASTRTMDHDASIFVASLPSFIEEHNLRPQLVDLFVGLNPLPADFQGIPRETPRLHTPIDVCNVKVVRDSGSDPVTTYAFIQLGSMDQVNNLLEFVSVHPLFGFGRVLRLERAKAYRALRIEVLEPLPENGWVRLSRRSGSRFVSVHTDISSAAAPSSDEADGLNGNGVVVPFSLPAVSVVHKLAEAFGPIESSRQVDTFPPSGDRDPAGGVNDDDAKGKNGAWIIKWQIRNDCVSALYALQQIPNLRVQWAHLALGNYGGFHGPPNGSPNGNLGNGQGVPPPGRPVGAAPPNRVQGALGAISVVTSDLNEKEWPTLSSIKAATSPSATWGRFQAPPSQPAAPAHSSPAQPAHPSHSSLQFGDCTPSLVLEVSNSTTAPVPTAPVAPAVPTVPAQIVKDSNTQRASPVAFKSEGRLAVPARKNATLSDDEIMTVPSSRNSSPEAVVVNVPSQQVVTPQEHQHQLGPSADSHEYTNKEGRDRHHGPGPRVNSHGRPNGRFNSGGWGAMDPMSIFVGNLEYGFWDEGRLKELFGQYGTITDMKYFAESPAKAGFAFVRYKEPEGPTQAIQGQDRCVYEGRSMKVQLKHLGPRTKWNRRSAAGEAKDPASSEAPPTGEIGNQKPPKERAATVTTAELASEAPGDGNLADVSASETVLTTQSSEPEARSHSPATSILLASSTGANTSASGSALPGEGVIRLKFTTEKDHDHGTENANDSGSAKSLYSSLASVFGSSISSRAGQQMISAPSTANNRGDPSSEQPEALHVSPPTGTYTEGQANYGYNAPPGWYPPPYQPYTPYQPLPGISQGYTSATQPPWTPQQAGGSYVGPPHWFPAGQWDKHTITMGRNAFPLSPASSIGSPHPRKDGSQLPPGSGQAPLRPTGFIQADNMLIPVYAQEALDNYLAANPTAADPRRAMPPSQGWGSAPMTYPQYPYVQWPGTPISSMYDVPNMSYQSPTKTYPRPSDTNPRHKGHGSFGNGTTGHSFNGASATMQPNTTGMMPYPPYNYPYGYPQLYPGYCPVPSSTTGGWNYGTHGG